MKCTRPQVTAHKTDELRNLRTCRVLLPDIGLDLRMLARYPKLSVFKAKDKIAQQERRKRKNSDNTCRLSTSTSSSDEGTYRVLQTRNKMPRTINNNRLRRQRRPFMGNIINRRWYDSSTSTSMESVAHEQCDNNRNNNLHSCDNETSITSTQDEGIKKVERRRVLSIIPSEIIIKTTLPEHADYRYALSINLLRYSKEREDNDPLTMFSREIPVEQTVYSEENIKETDSTTDEHINEKKGKCHISCDINESVSDVETAEILIKLRNDKDKNVLIFRQQDNVAQNKTINSKETIINESLPINGTTQLGKSDVNDQISENVLSEDTLDPMDIDERCDFISKPSVYGTEENAESPTCSAYRNKNTLERAYPHTSSMAEKSTNIRSLSTKERPSSEICGKEKNNIQMVKTANNNYIYSQDTLQEMQRTNEEDLSTRKDTDTRSQVIVNGNTSNDNDDSFTLFSSPNEFDKSDEADTNRDEGESTREEEIQQTGWFTRYISQLIIVYFLFFVVLTYNVAFIYLIIMKEIENF